jgi:hypothetical protein
MALDPILARMLVDRLTAAEREIAGLKARLAAIEAKAVIEYRGIWKSGQRYPRGTAITHDGGLWIADDVTDQRPGNGPENGWRLAVKRGNGAPPEPPPARVPTMPRSNGRGR